MLSKLKYLIVLLALGCQEKETIPLGNDVLDRGEEFSAGTGTVFDLSENAFGQQLPNLTSLGSDNFVLGNSFFRSNWTTAPASASLRDGLGPMLNATSCGSCHMLDGRGKPPIFEGEPMSSMIIRLSKPGAGMHGEPLGEDNYGEQLSNHAIQNVIPEGLVKMAYSEIKGSYADGAGYTIYQPHYAFYKMNYGIPGNNLLFSPRLAQQIPGLGFLEAIDEATIVALADPNDMNHDGISGRPNYVWDVSADKQVLGRFGWKANQPNIRQQVAAAFSGDIGITTTLFPAENLSEPQKIKYGNLQNGGNPELPDPIFDNVVFYTSTLAIPARRNWSDPNIIKGKQIFNNIKCNSCHTPKITTGSHPQIPELSNQVIRPYTDILLHDMGEGLADGRPDFLASGNEWRTPPLWGIGMIKTVNKQAFYLHDGRARSLEEAILWHGGEAAACTSDFKKLTVTERQALLDFLDSL